MKDAFKPPFLVKGDIDGFFGLMVDNLVQLLLIIFLCSQFCGMKGDYAYLIYARILPGAAISILFGNIFYGWQARRLARKEGRSDVCAMPYGINTAPLFAFIFFIMVPVYRETGNPDLAWKIGVAACFFSGLVEFIGAFFAEYIRKATPRAALLSTLSGIAIAIIALPFALQIFAHPFIAMAPFAIILIQYFSKVRFPWGLPGGFVAIIVGTVLAWIFSVPAIADYFSAGEPLIKIAGIKEAFSARGWYPPLFNLSFFGEILRQNFLIKYLSIIIPMGVMSVIGSMQNIESADAAGDSFSTRSSLAVDGLGSMLAALFGSCFPTTMYIGHPGWKGLGARSGYSTLNGIFFFIVCVTGAIGLIDSVIPIQAGIAIVFWIGIVITAQAFQATPAAHAPAVAVGLFPAIAALGAGIIKTFTSSEDIIIFGATVRGFFIMEAGFIFTSMILAAISVYLIERRFYRAAVWSAIGAVLSFIGVIHAYAIKPGNQTISDIGWGAGKTFAFGYCLMGLIFFFFYLFHRKEPADSKQ